MSEIIIKKVEFKHCNEWNLDLHQYDIITPIWKRGKCVRMLITRARTGEAVYMEANARKIYISVSISVFYTPHGITYQLNENAHLSILTTMISLIKRKV